MKLVQKRVLSKCLQVSESLLNATAMLFALLGEVAKEQTFTEL